MTVAPQADTETVTGTVQGIIQKGQGKWQVEVNVGQQNPRRLWTKDEGVVQQMATLIGQQISFMCGKSHWERQDGTPVTSLWINGYGSPNAVPTTPVVQQPQWTQPLSQVAAEAQPQVPVMQTPAAPAVPVSRDIREEKIHRQTASKVAVHLLKHLSPEDQTFTNLITLSERLVAYYENGVEWPQQADGDGAPPHTDDDIPF